MPNDTPDWLKAASYRPPKRLGTIIQAAGGSSTTTFTLDPDCLALLLQVATSWAYGGVGARIAVHVHTASGEAYVPLDLVGPGSYLFVTSISGTGFADAAGATTNQIDVIVRQGNPGSPQVVDVQELFQPAASVSLQGQYPMVQSSPVVIASDQSPIQTYQQQSGGPNPANKTFAVAIASGAIADLGAVGSAGQNFWLNGFVLTTNVVAIMNIVRHDGLGNSTTFFSCWLGSGVPLVMFPITPWVLGGLTGAQVRLGILNSSAGAANAYGAITYNVV